MHYTLIIKKQHSIYLCSAAAATNFICINEASLQLGSVQECTPVEVQLCINYAYKYKVANDMQYMIAT